MKTFVVIPAYNEAKRVGIVLEELLKYKLPIIVIDDGSTDKTLEVIKKYNVICLVHKINLGKGAAIKTGSEAAFRLGAEAVVIMDADGQHKPEDLSKFIEQLNTEKYGVIFGSRNLSFGAPLVRFLGNKFASIIISLFFGIYISDLICGYRAFTKKVYEKLNLQSSNYGIETEMVIKTARYKIKYCEISIEAIYYDKFKGVTILDASGILIDVIRWRIFK